MGSRHSWSQRTEHRPLRADGSWLGRQSPLPTLTCLPATAGKPGSASSSVDSAEKLCPSAALAKWGEWMTTPQTPHIHCDSAQGEGAHSLTENWSTKLWAMEFQHLLPRHSPLLGSGSAHRSKVSAGWVFQAEDQHKRGRPGSSWRPPGHREGDRHTYYGSGAGRCQVL